MLAQRDRESLLELMGRLDRAIASAANTTMTIDEIYAPGGFKPRKELKSQPPWAGGYISLRQFTLLLQRTPFGPSRLHPVISECTQFP
jgi:hypothetical protein